MNVKLYTISKRGFFSSTYEILEDGKHLYTAISRFFLRGYYIHSTLGHKIMTIRRPFSFFNTLFILEKGEIEIARMKRKLSFTENDISIEAGNDKYEVDGNFWSTDFTILKNGVEIAKISRKLMRSKDKYGIAVNENEDPVVVLAIALVVELIQKIKSAKG